jgi:peroxiredoxin
MKRPPTPISEPVKRQGLIARKLSDVEEEIKQFIYLEEGDELPSFFTNSLLTNKLTAQRWFFDATKGSGAVKIESLRELAIGTVILLTMPDPTTCIHHLRSFIRSLPEIKAQGVKLAILTRDNAEPMHQWLLSELRQADWVKYNPTLFFSPTLVQANVLALSDIYLEILPNLGICPHESPSLGLVYPRGLYLIENGKILKKNIEFNVSKCEVSSAEQALKLIKEIKINQKNYNLKLKVNFPAIFSYTLPRAESPQINPKVKHYLELCQNHSKENDPEVNTIDLQGENLAADQVALLMHHLKSSVVATTIKCLDLSNTSGLTEIIIPFMPKLETLRIGSRDLLSYKLPSEPMPHLTEFSIAESSKLNNINIAEIFYKCPNLKKIHYNNVVLSSQAEELIQVFCNQSSAFNVKLG